MSLFGPVISAVSDFLNDAQSLGLVKEFNLIQTYTNYDEVPGADLLVSQFLKKLNDISFVNDEQREAAPTWQFEIKSKFSNFVFAFEAESLPHPKSFFSSQDVPEMIPAKTSSSDDEYVFVEDEKVSESECTLGSPANENSEMPVNIDEASIDSYNSCVAEQMNEEEKPKIDVSHSIEKVSSEKIIDMKRTNEVTEKDELEASVKKNLVQINVDTNEMKRRISAFISRKRKEVDEWNVQEFCGRSYVDEQDPAWEKLDSCARVDAVFVPRRGCKSHIKVSRVQNVWGPQTHWQPEAKKIKQEPGEVENQPNDATLQAMDERLQILETHLKLKTDNGLRKNLFKRIKSLEDKILFIESTSPEYLHVLNPDFSSNKMKNSEEKINLNNVDEIQKRIEALRSRLKMKSV